MKIQLERTLSSCPNKMTCIVCRQIFQVGDLRALVYNRHQLIQGDACPKCVKLKPFLFQQKLRNHAYWLMHEPASTAAHALTMHNRAMELLDTAEEPIQFPTFLHWMVKRLEAFSANYQELEAARRGTSECHCRRRSPKLNRQVSRLRLQFTDEELLN